MKINLVVSNILPIFVPYQLKQIAMQDTHKTDVIFRVDNNKGFIGSPVFALMPHEVDDHKGNVMCYQHVGQHSSADYNHCINTSKPATELEYADLKAELESIGYNLNIVKKQNRKKYLKSYYENKFA